MAPRLPMSPVLRKRLLAVSAAGTMTIAATLVSLHEGRRYAVYLDPVGIPTVCDGITGPDVVYGKRYTDMECDALTAKHLRIAETAVRRQIPSYPLLSKWAQAALLDFAFNLGEAKLAGSTLRKKFNAGDIVGGCEELMKWDKARVQGTLQSLRGLTQRRSNTTEICLNWTT